MIDDFQWAKEIYLLFIGTLPGNRLWIYNFRHFAKDVKNCSIFRTGEINGSGSSNLGKRESVNCNKYLPEHSCYSKVINAKRDESGSCKILEAKLCTVLRTG